MNQQLDLFTGYTSPNAWRAQQLAQQTHDISVAELINQNTDLVNRINEVKAEYERVVFAGGLLFLWAGLATFGFVALLGVVAGGG